MRPSLARLLAATLMWGIAHDVSTASAAEVAEIQVERIFGPELPHPYKHPASFTQLADGDFYLVYYAGEGEYAEDTFVCGARYSARDGQWSQPAVISDTPFRSEGNAVVWQAPDGIVWLYHVIRYGETWSASRIVAKISRDGARTWSDPIVVSFDEGMMVRSRPIDLGNGDHLLPVYHETGADPDQVGADSSSLFLRFDHATHQWTETNRVHSPKGNIQPAVARVADDYLVAYCRRGGGYGPSTDSYIVRTESRDGGLTWSEGKDSAFPNPNAAVDFIRLQNGHLLLVYNDSMEDRTPLTIAISTDGDRTYPHRRDIATGPGDFAYPTVLQAADGKIHVVYTTDQRTVIRRAIFEESDILGHQKP